MDIRKLMQMERARLQGPTWDDWILRGCSLEEAQRWGAGNANTDHPTGYSLCRSFYRSEAEWKKAIEASISFAKAAGSKAIVIFRDCGSAPPEGSDTYRTPLGLTLRKKQVPLDAVFVAYRELREGEALGDLADWVISQLVA